MRKLPPTVSEHTQLTTGQTASLLQVSPRTIVKWFDLGMFPNAYTMPHSNRRGGPDRRIPAVSVVSFCRAYQVPIPPDLKHLDKPPLVFVAGLPTEQLNRFTLCVSPLGRIWSAGLLEVVSAVGAQRPDGVLLGTTEGFDMAVRAAAAILEIAAPPRIALVLSDDADPLDDRLGNIRDRVSWIGIEPPTWRQVVQSLLVQRLSTEGGT